MDTKPTPAEIVIMASGAVVLIFSFFPWFEVAAFAGSVDFNAWSTEITFPLGTYVPVIGLVMGGVVALTRFANVSLPERVVDFTWTQLHLVLSVFAVLIMLGYLIIGDGLQFGFIICLLASIGLLVGAVLLRTEHAATAGPGPSSGPPQPFWGSPAEA